MTSKVYVALRVKAAPDRAFDQRELQCIAPAILLDRRIGPARLELCRFQGRADRGDRRAQLVRGVGDQRFLLGEAPHRGTQAAPGE